MGRVRDFLARPLAPGLPGGDVVQNEVSESVERAQVAEVDGLFDLLVPQWHRENLGGLGSAPVGNARLADRVWAAARCQQMNSQQIAAMPLEWHGPDGGTEPLWVSNPDPEIFPNGIGDAIHSIVDQMYGWGYAILYMTGFYADGFPRTWTQIDSATVEPTMRDGQRVYPISGGGFLDPDRVVQIDRNPGVRGHGTSALRAYWQMAWGLHKAGDQAMTVTDGVVPSWYLKSKRPLNKKQANAIQQQWAERITKPGSLPPVLPPEIDAEKLSINPSDLALLETQEFNARAVCTAYGVPSVLLNLALQGGLTYQNPAALGEMWWRFELRNVATRVGNAFSARLLPRGQFVSFRAEDTFAPITQQSTGDDEQAAFGQPTATANASPTQSKLAAVTG